MFFYIYAIQYLQNSYGQRCLFELGYIINSIGYNVRILVTGKGDNIPEKYISLVVYDESSIEVSSSDIVIYPDGITGNPLKALNVVRYILAPEFLNTSTHINYGENDYIVSYSKQVDSLFPQMYILNNENDELFSMEHVKKRNMACIYHGKHIDKYKSLMNEKIDTISNDFDEVITITRDHPKSKVELLKLLKEAKLLISLDPLSSLNYEATLCNTPVYILDDITFGKIEELEFNIKLWGFFSDYRNYSIAQKEVKKARPLYKETLKGNKLRVQSSIDNIIRHFSLIKENVDYKERTFERNRLRYMLMETKIRNGDMTSFSNRTGNKISIKKIVKQVLPYGIVKLLKK